jgi:hypothetical protein
VWQRAAKPVCWALLLNLRGDGQENPTRGKFKHERDQKKSSGGKRKVSRAGDEAEDSRRLMDVKFWGKVGEHGR